MYGLGFVSGSGLGFRGLGFRGLGFRGVRSHYEDSMWLLRVQGCQSFSKGQGLGV